MSISSLKPVGRVTTGTAAGQLKLSGRRDGQSADTAGMVLAQSGLEPALGTLADRSAIPVRLHVALAGRLPSDVEATAYYVVSEALTNAARHSGASVVVVEVASTVGCGSR